MDKIKASTLYVRYGTSGHEFEWTVNAPEFNHDNHWPMSTRNIVLPEGWALDNRGSRLEVYPPKEMRYAQDAPQVVVDALAQVVEWDDLVVQVIGAEPRDFECVLGHTHHAANDDEEFDVASACRRQWMRAKIEARRSGKN